MGPRSPSSLPGPVTSPGVHAPSNGSTTQLPTPAASPTASQFSIEIDEDAKHNTAWKYEGYQALSQWMATDDDFFVVRRFGKVNAHVILWMQHQISQKEKILANLHERMELTTDAKNGIEGRNDSFEWDILNMPERHNLMRDLAALLLHYNKYVNAYSKIRARPGAEKRQVRNLERWFLDEDKEDREVIDKDECEFVTHTHDLMSIGLRERPPLGEWLESCQRLQRARPFRVKPKEGKHVVSAATQYSSNARFEAFTKGAIILGGLAMLLAPIWWLAYVSATKVRLSVITGFLCAFISVMATATNKPFEAVAATAAYAAVLMVFMQIQVEGKDR